MLSAVWLRHRRRPLSPVRRPPPSAVRRRPPSAAAVRCSLPPRLRRRLRPDRRLRERHFHLGLHRLRQLEALESGIRWGRRERELLLIPEVPRLLSQRRAS